MDGSCCEFYDNRTGRSVCLCTDVRSDIPTCSFWIRQDAHLCLPKQEFHLPENTHPAKEGHDIKIDQVVIGSCTNGRLEDLAQAAEILKGRKVCDHVRMIIIPATQQIYQAAMHLGYIDTFIEAGAAVSTPTCGPCLGGYMGILAAGERAVSTTNRNFRGRMGHVDSEVYLASPYTAAASAITGYITSPEEVVK